MSRHHSEENGGIDIQKGRLRVPITPEWLWRGIVILMLATGMWLQTHYVSRQEFEQAQQTITTITLTLARLEAANKTLDDHEVRLRTVENKVASMPPRFRPPPPNN